MRISILASLGLSLLACRGGGGNNGDDQPGVDAPVGGSVKIQDVQNDAMPKGTAVELHGVVVTAIDAFGARTGDIWVEEVGGGPFSGVKMFGVALDQLAALTPGDLVDVTNAEKDEFALTADTSGRTTTELKGAGGGMISVVKTGAGAVPTPDVVDALAIAALDDAGKDAEWEKWEGVLITVANVTQTGAVKSFGSATPTPEDSFKFEVNGKLVVESLMTGFPTSAAPEFCYASLTGIGDYFFDHLLIPRVAEDIGAMGSTCPTETDHAACSDGLDNDFDGFMDCADISCQNSDPACTTTTTIAEIQSGAVVGQVILNDVFVSARSKNNKNFWITQSLTAAPNEGIFVFGTAATLDAGIVAGAKVNVTGQVTENNDSTPGGTLTEIKTPTVTVIAPPATPIIPVAAQQASSLVVDATGEPFESVLVTLTNVKLTVLGDPTPMTGNFGVGELQQGTTKFLTDDDISLLADPVGTCYATVTGIWTFQVFEDKFGLLPISKTVGGTCP
jgi:hypothetical protein